MSRSCACRWGATSSTSPRAWFTQARGCGSSRRRRRRRSRPPPARVLADGSYRRAAERIAAAIAEETATDLAVAEIEAVVATATEREAVMV